MDWELPAEAQALRATLTTWSERRLERIRTLAVHEPDAWAQLAEIGLLRVEREGERSSTKRLDSQQRLVLACQDPCSRPISPWRRARRRSPSASRTASSPVPVP